MASLKEKKLQSVGGGFVMVATTAFEEHKIKEGDTLSTAKLIGDYVRAALALGDDGIEVKANDGDIVRALRAVTIEDGMNNEDKEERFLSAIRTLETSREEIPDMPSIMVHGNGSPAALAVAYGQMIAASTGDHVKFAIKAQIDADAGPRVLCLDLETQFGQMKDKDGDYVLDLWPLFGTRNQEGSKHNKAPFAYKVPANSKDRGPDVWNGPFHHYDAKMEDGTIRKGDFVKELVAASPDGKPYADRAVHARAILKGEPKVGCPADLVALKKEGNMTKIMAEEAEAAFQFGRRVTIYGTAIRLLQKKRAIASHFKGAVEVHMTGEQFGETPEQCARRRKPFVLHQVNPETKSSFAGHPITQSRLLAIEPRRFSADTKIGTLIEVKRKKGTGKGITGATSKAPAITTIFELQNAVSEVQGYVANKERYSAILAACNDPQTGDEFSAAIVATYDALDGVVSKEGVRAAADRYNTRVNEALAKKPAAA